MSSISSYLYDNIITVQILDEDPILKTRNKIVYSRPLKIQQGVDNVVTINLQNSDQKPANIVGKNFQFTISSQLSAIWTTNITIANAASSIGTIVVDKANVANLTASKYNYAISYTYGNLSLAAYTNDNFDAKGQLEIIPTKF